MAYRDRYSPPRGPPERWDRDRFDAYARGPPVVERDRYEEVDYYSPPRREPAPAPRRVEEKYFFEEKDRYEIPHRPRREQARFYEDEGSSYEGAMVPVRRREDDREIEIDIHRREYDREYDHRPRASPNPQRPTFVRRQSSLDTFDRRPIPRYGDRVREEVIQIPAGPRRRSPPRYRSPPHFVEREREEEVHVVEPEYYVDDDYRGYREREISRVRRNRDYEVEEEREEIVETEFPKRGKTKMPMRLVNKAAIIKLGYPFEEEVNSFKVKWNDMLRSHRGNKSSFSKLLVRSTLTKSSRSAARSTLRLLLRLLHHRTPEQLKKVRHQISLFNSHPLTSGAHIIRVRILIRAPIPNLLQITPCYHYQPLLPHYTTRKKQKRNAKNLITRDIN